MNCSFTHAHYHEIISVLLESGYRFVGFSDFVPDVPLQVILRHDVDFSLEDALRIAQVEAQLGITSVFHVLLTSEIYNPACAAGQEILAKISRLGHRIGLHVDPVAIERGTSSLEAFHKRLQNLFDVATLVIGRLDSYSIHRPAANKRMQALQPVLLPFPVPLYAESAVFREQVIYRSDSRRKWRHGCICTQIPGFQGRSLQLLIHPLWWTPQPCTRDEVLANLVERQKGRAIHCLRNNLSFYE